MALNGYTYFPRLILSVEDIVNWICRCWHRQRFLIIESASLETSSLGEDTQFYVPVCVGGGRGQLTIGARNKFGLQSAPRFGNGSIFLQPRSPGSQISLGHGNWLNNNTVICANEKVTIGNGCQIGDQVAIYDCDFHEISPESRWNSDGLTSPVTIGSNVWLGSRVIVLKGVTIGDNSVIGAMSLVTRSIPANSVAAGCPAKVIRSIRENE